MASRCVSIISAAVGWRCRALQQARRGTSSLVSEIDPGVVKIDSEQLGLKTGDGIEVLVEDGEAPAGPVAGDSHDLVIGDAFGGVSVPWHPGNPRGGWGGETGAH